MRLASFSGGTDINGCFALGNPIGPVCRGRAQCRGLGMEGDALTAELADTIRKRIRNNTTPRHVP